MSKIIWDQAGEKTFETGCDRGVFYPAGTGDYTGGEGWNGLVSVTISPSGAEPTALWANNTKYGNLISTEEVGGSIEAYMYPDGFASANGMRALAKGARIGQQKRTPFGMTYRNLIGNDTEGTTHGYKIHIVYGMQASPSEDAATTVNDSPEAKTMSWEFSTTPVTATGFDNTSHIEIDSRTTDAEKLKALEDILYGTEDDEPRLPLPDEIATILGTAA